MKLYGKDSLTSKGFKQFSYCRQWPMHHQGVTGVNSKHASNIYIYQTTVMTFEETQIVDKYSIVQRKSWRQRQSWKWISVQTERIERHSEKTPIYRDISTKQ